MVKKTLLIEIGTEEIPYKSLYKISLSFYNNFIYELNVLDILYKKINIFCTPRRLALQVIDMDVSRKITEINKRGPSIHVSFDSNGLPTKIANHWMNNYGINIDQTLRLKTKKGEWLLFRSVKKQEKIQDLLPKIIETSLKKINMKNTMRWERTNQKFSRPIRNIVMLLDDRILPGKIFNITPNNFLHHHLCFKKNEITIQHAKEYPSILLKKSNIIADYNIRKQKIIEEIKRIALSINGFLKINNILIDEVTSLVESPVALLGNFQDKFLRIPKTILVYTIESQQKCFPIYDAKQDILPFFICISNTHSKKPNEIIKGNERVMNARLSDTNFFLKNDKKLRLDQYLPLLKKVVFHKTIGSLYEKTYRIKSLVEWISSYTKSNVKDSIRSAMLSKCDLITDMVSAFPKLQGTIGMYYALQDKEKKDVSIALKEQYLPSFSGDILPSTLIGLSLSIADKIDTLSGMFYIGKTPNADKDPFALRRLCIGIIRIIIINKIPLNLKDLINKSLSLYNKKNIHNVSIYTKIIEFFILRLQSWYIENGYNINIIKSVLSQKPTQLIDIHQKIQALSYFQKSDHAQSIILSIKRISNILGKNNQKITGKFNVKLIEKEEERQLFFQISNILDQTKILFIEKQYQKILLQVHTINRPIENFFNKVRIHDSNPRIKLNRLILLKKIENFFSKIANFSFLY